MDRTAAETVLHNTGVEFRNGALAAAIKLCRLVASRGGTAEECAKQIEALRDIMNKPATESPSSESTPPCS